MVPKIKKKIFTISSFHKKNYHKESFFYHTWNSNFHRNFHKRIKASEKRLKFFEYFRNLSTPTGFVFLQETHSSVNVENKWNNGFQGKVFFSHGKTNYCGGAIGYYRKKSFKLLSKLNDKSGCMLILEVKIENEVFIINQSLQCKHGK